jgi:hypothetical protein
MRYAMSVERQGQGRYVPPGSAQKQVSERILLMDRPLRRGRASPANVIGAMALAARPDKLLRARNIRWAGCERNRACGQDGHQHRAS